MKKFERNCPNCDKKLIYKYRSTYRSAVKKDGRCKLCSNKLIPRGYIKNVIESGPWNKGMNKFNNIKVKEISTRQLGYNNSFVRSGGFERYYNISYDEFIKLEPKKKQYYKNVWKYTKQQPIHLLENFEKRGPAGIDGAYHLDHIIPISYGFKKSIAPEKIGYLYNLRFIPWRENVTKKNSIPGMEPYRFKDGTWELNTYTNLNSILDLQERFQYLPKLIKIN